MDNRLVQVHNQRQFLLLNQVLGIFGVHANGLIARHFHARRRVQRGKRGLIKRAPGGEWLTPTLQSLSHTGHIALQPGWDAHRPSPGSCADNGLVERVDRAAASIVGDLHMNMPRLRDMADVYGASQRLTQT